MIHIKNFMVNPLGVNSLLLYDETGEAVMMDPGFYYTDEEEALKNFVEDKNLTLMRIINTHCHFDHIMGVEFVRNQYKIPFCAHSLDSYWVDDAVEKGKMFGFGLKPVRPIDVLLDDLKTVKFGNSELEIIHVPGHSPGHVVFYNRENGFLLAGDVLFYGSIGRTDLPGGDYNTLITNIKNKILTLPPETKVYCGHGPRTTIGFERSSNPFLT